MANEQVERLYQNLPSLFRNADAEQKYQLKRFLDILVSGGFKPLHEETSGLLNLIDIDKIPAQFLPHIASDLGFQYLHDVDEQTQRIYIKNAVASYRIKGTTKALLFMLRELTKSMVTVDIDEVEKELTVILQVDLDRQDIGFLQNKARYIIDEYAPPYAKLNLVNLFIWEEVFNARTSNDELTVNRIKGYDSHDKQSTLHLNDTFSTLNNLSFNLSSFQQYNRNAIHYDYSESYGMGDEILNRARISEQAVENLKMATSNSFERSRIQYFTTVLLEGHPVHPSDYLFILAEHTSTTGSEFNQLSGPVDRWNKEKYAIIGKDNQTEFTNQETYDSMETQDDFTDTITYLNED